MSTTALKFEKVSNSKENKIFVTPPEAVVFCPNDEEFKDPYAYIAKIRPMAEKMGICKIKPPSQWKPPFAVDVDKFTFTPRVQKLNEMDAKTRIKLNFMVKIAKFWELQGTVMKIPLVEGKTVDLYTLHKTVHAEGGFISVRQLKKWPAIARLMGYQTKEAVTNALENHYERILFPFDLLNDSSKKSNTEVANKINRLQLNQAPENALQVPKKRGRKPKNNANKKTKRVNQNDDILAQYICRNCNLGDAEESMLLCDGCDDGYHTFCLTPPLRGIPKGDWCCPKCVAEECLRPMDAFGFQQAQREYNLQQFGEMADRFKAGYFKVPPSEVPTSTVEQDYWQIISSVEEGVVVEYGADLHAMDHGSGFPTMSSKNLSAQDKEYAQSPWNLNNLSELEGSVLKYINATVSGIKIPWMYVGMCFATFCWHNEDHWTYSINYLHWGEPKTWYAVPGDHAEAFEAAMQSAAPELFKSQPDLLHQLVTMINPNILMRDGVPVYRTDQYAGEFVVTFPRAYHAGFNQGYNFAEAVNFAPADWLMVARDSVLEYSKLRRFCVFAHDELICKIASEKDKLVLNIATVAYQDMLVMVNTERTLRRYLHHSGVSNGERVIFESIPDDERQCEVCKTTCFLSALCCKCSEGRLVCLRDSQRLCQCAVEDKVLKYRYTLEELYNMLKELKLKAEAFDEWVARVKLIMNKKTSQRVYLKDLKILLNDAADKKFPKCDLLQRLSSAVKKAEKFIEIIRQLKDYKNNSKQVNSKFPRITLNELRIFKEEINGLACLLEETAFIDNMLQQGKVFEKTNAVLLSEPLHLSQADYLEQCKQYCYSTGIGLPDLEKIILRQEQLQWLQTVENLMSTPHVVTTENLSKIINDGHDLRNENTPIIENQLSGLRELLEKTLNWEKKACNVLNSNNCNVLITAEELLQQALNIKCHLPTERVLYKAVREAKHWIQLYEEIIGKEDYPFFNTLEDLMLKGKQLDFHLVQVDEMEERLEVARCWRSEAAAVFLGETSLYSLLEALTPRTVNRAFLECLVQRALDFATISEGMKQAEHVEIEFTKMLYRRNMDKWTNFYDNCFCLCTEGPRDTMIRCHLCRDWFHCDCLGLQDIQIFLFRCTSPKYLCPNCKRTKRPNKEEILKLLLNLQKLRVVVPEGEVFKCLVERALNWETRAQIFIENLQKISSLDGKKYILPMDPLLKVQIEEITMEGDLLEVSLPNNMTLYKVLRAIEKHSQIKNVINCDRNPVEENSLFKIVDVQSLNPEGMLPYHEHEFSGTSGTDSTSPSDFKCESIEINEENINVALEDEIRQDWDAGVLSADSGVGSSPAS